MKKKVINSDSSKGEEVPKVKERHIVSWSQEEDDILREQIRVHGTENWTIIASKFKDKTTRQCRRRWYTYLNSDFKKGGWSPEEDTLLCEAQKVFGNRWTEIAKVVSGRTDNAVKNRFTTLCKKRAKHEALAKENGATSYINLNNKRIIFPNGLNTDGGAENTAPLKKLRTYIQNTTEENIPRECGVENQLLRPPFTVLAQNISSSGVDLLSRSHVKEAVTFDGSENKKVQGVFLKKDDPKVLALMQQEELLTSLATKVNSDNMDQSLDSAWTVLQDYLKQNKESDLPSSRNSSSDFQLERIDELVEELRSSSEGSRPSWREPDIYAFSPDSSEYSTGSTVLPADKTEECQPKICLPHQETEQTLQPDQLDNQICVAKESGVCHTATSNGGAAVNMLTCNEVEASNGAVSDYSNTEFSSPLHVTPLFRSLAAAIPSPKFSESEKNFLMKTLGMESASSSIISNTSQPPTCKRSLLHCL